MQPWKQGDRWAGWVVVTQKQENGEEWTWKKVAGAEKQLSDGISRTQ